jgi:hypothetical protein
MEKLTRKQQNALHLLFEKMAKELNDCGLDMKKTLKPEIDIPWSKDTIKEMMWKPIQKAQLSKEHTSDLTRKEIDEVYDTINRLLGEKLKVQMPPFPNIRDLIGYELDD